MINKDVFLNQLKTLNINTDTYNRLIKLYDDYRSQHFGGNINLGSTVDLILTELFKGALDDFSIPISFINSPVGNVIFSLKFGIKKNNYFTPNEVALLTSKTKALVSHDIRYTKKLNASTHSNGKRFIISESDLISYMKDKGLSETESFNKINLFLKLKNEGMNLDSIKLELDKLNQE